MKEAAMSVADPDLAIPRLETDRERLSREAVVTIGLLVASTFTLILNEMMMAVALPHVMANLSITASTAQWLPPIAASEIPRVRQSHSRADPRPMWSQRERGS